MNTVILYSTETCPKCKILKTKLQQKEIEYYEVNDIDVMEKKDIFSVPVLEVDGQVMQFKEAVDWVNGR